MDKFVVKRRRTEVTEVMPTEPEPPSAVQHSRQSPDSHGVVTVVADVHVDAERSSESEWYVSAALLFRVPTAPEKSLKSPES